MIKQASVAPLLLAFLVPFVSLAQSPLEDAGCTNTAAGYVCPQPSSARMYVTYLDDVECYSQGTATCTSDCAGIIDIGCFGVLSPNRDVAYRACDTVVNATTVDYNANCRDEVLRAGTQVTALLDPAIIDYSACSKSADNGTYVIRCPYKGRVQDANVSFAGGSVILLSATDAPGVSIDTAIIALLVVAIAAVALWILRPAKSGAAAGERRLRRRERRQ